MSEKKQYVWETEEVHGGVYYTLRDPDGKELVCLSLTDAPEDIAPSRDLAPIVAELNRLHAIAVKCPY